MKYGICTDPEYAEGVKLAGFDYIELKTYDVALASEVEFEHIKNRLGELNIPCEAINFFYPPLLQVVGPDIDENVIDNYIQKALDRAGRLGVRMITVGSSKSRRIPEGFSVDAARQQFAAQLYRMGELGEPLGITIAIEPIRPESTNFINTIREAADICRQTGHEAVKIMADYYQMYGAGDEISEVIRYGDLIRHLHTIDLEQKGYPSNPEDKGQKALFQAYGGNRVSIEGAEFTTVEVARQALKSLKRYTKK